MKTGILIALCLLTASTVISAKDKKDLPQDKVTVILEDNLAQQGGKIAENAPPPYNGDIELKNAFATLQTRLQTMLVNSGRVNVKPKSSASRAASDEKTYLCSYTLVQGRIVGQKGMNKEYLIGINLQAWNYLDETPFPQLTRTVDIRISEETPENAFKFVTRYLAFITLESISPVVIVEKDGSVVSVSAGGELLQPGDILRVRKGLKKVAAIRVTETDALTSICEITEGDAEVGAKCIFQLPAENQGTQAGMKNSTNYVPKIEIGKVVVTAPHEGIVTPLEAKAKGSSVGEAVKLGAGLAGGLFGGKDKKNVTAGATGVDALDSKTYSVESGSVASRSDLANLSTMLTTGIKSKPLGIIIISNDGPDKVAPDYVLSCDITSYSEAHTGSVIENGVISFSQSATMTVLVSLMNRETNELVGGHAIPVEVTYKHPGATCADKNTTASLVNLNDVASLAADKVAETIREVTARTKK